jgi:hypothetical protein
MEGFMNQAAFLMLKTSAIEFFLGSIAIAFWKTINFSGEDIITFLLIYLLLRVLGAFMYGFFGAAWKDLKNLSWRKR